MRASTPSTKHTTHLSEYKMELANANPHLWRSHDCTPASAKSANLHMSSLAPPPATMNRSPNQHHQSLTRAQRVVALVLCGKFHQIRSRIVILVESFYTARVCCKQAIPCKSIPSHKSFEVNNSTSVRSKFDFAQVRNSAL